MNKLLHKIIAILCLGMTLNCQSQNIRVLENINVFNNYGEEKQLSKTTSFDRWVLIIINKDLNVATQILERLDDKALDLSKTVILVLGNLENQSSSDNLDFYQTLTPYKWLRADDSKILSQLQLAGTPVILGINTEINTETNTDTINWQISGMHSKADFARIKSHINSWSKDVEILSYITKPPRNPQE